MNFMIGVILAYHWLTPALGQPKKMRFSLFRSIILILALLVGSNVEANSKAPYQLNPTDLTEQALHFVHGEGVNRDPDLAVVYLCAAARHGYARAAYELGWLYFQGRGVPRDDALAAAWLSEAMRLGGKVGERVMQQLASVKKKPLRCVDSQGSQIYATDTRRAKWVLTVYELAPLYGLDPLLVLEVIKAESNFNPKARSPKGALGLMQLIPATAKRFGVSDPLEPAQNLRGGMAYLRWLKNRFDGDLQLALAGYNAGEHSVERYGGVPPYAETRSYVKTILGRYTKTALTNY